MLFAKAGLKENVVVRGARVIDTLEGIDAVMDVRVDDGVISALGTDLDTNSHRVVEGDGLLLASIPANMRCRRRTRARDSCARILSVAWPHGELG